MKKLLCAALVALLTLCLPSCVAYRFIRYGTEGIDDYKTFPTDTVRAAAEPFRFVEGHAALLDTLRLSTRLGRLTLAQTIDTLAGSKRASAGLVVMRNDTILFERYLGEISAGSHSTVFSISKSITSLLVGMAIDKGYIASVTEPVTTWLPELARRDERFNRLTVEHLLDMRAGLRFEENYSPNPFSAMARLHYGRHMMRQIRNQRLRTEPGTEFYYSSMATAMLGALLERATGRRYADLLTEWVWQPLGMEHDALVNLDDEHHRMAKAYGGVSTNARDLVRFGRLYLHGGAWEGRQLVDAAWVARSLSPEWAARNNYYTNSWRSVGISLGKWDDPVAGAEACVERGYDPERLHIVRNADGTWQFTAMSDWFYALGVFGQVVFVDPAKGIVAVFIGSQRIDDYQRLFAEMAAYM